MYYFNTLLKPFSLFVQKKTYCSLLEDFNNGVEIDSSKINKYSKGDQRKDKPEIIIDLTFEKDELKNRLETSGFDLSKVKVKLPLEIQLIKRYPDTYIFEPELLKLLNLEADEQIKNKAGEELSIIDDLFKEKKALFAKVGKTSGKVFPDLNGNNLSKTLSDLEVFESNINSLPTNKLHPTHKKNFIDSIKMLALKIEDYQEEFNVHKTLLDALCPNFILFSSFEDNLKGNVEISSIEGIMKDVVNCFEIDTDLLEDGDDLEITEHIDNCSMQANSDYSSFWNQDNSQLIIRHDGGNLLLQVRENKTHFYPEQRSKGKQWHLSFYIKLTANSKKGDDIILIDEPGLFLHAQAQRDIYKKLLDTGKDNQVLFTTHSPYLINSDELHRLRLVQKTEAEGSNIVAQIHKVSDHETMTPIYTAIGLNIGEGIQDQTYKNNIVVEGMSDYYYLTAFQNILKHKKFKIVFGGGSGKMGVVGSILTGWGCEVLYLFDNDKGGTDGKKNLKSKWFVSDDQIEFIRPTKGEASEDIFSNTDFKKHVLEDDTLSYIVSNSQIAKDKKINKVITSKEFLVKKNLKLEKETTDRAKLLFTTLEDKFKANSSSPT